MKAMIFAAGLGTRMKPVTDYLPKALVKFRGIPMIEYIIKNLVNAGVTDIIINIHHFPELIKEYIQENNSFGINIQYSDETEQLLETGGGLKNAAWFFDDNKPFIIHNVDVFTSLNLNELYNFHLNSENLMTLACTNRKTSRNLLFDENQRLWAWQNNINGEFKGNIPPGKLRENLNPLAYSTISVVNPEIFNLITETGKFSLVDVWLRLAPHHPIGAYVHNHDVWIDMSSNFEK